MLPPEETQLTGEFRALLRIAIGKVTVHRPPPPTSRPEPRILGRGGGGSWLGPVLVSDGLGKARPICSGGHNPLLAAARRSLPFPAQDASGFPGTQRPGVKWRSESEVAVRWVSGWRG